MLGIVPAAGAGSRIQPLAFSKELLPVGSRWVDGAERPRAVSEYLLERMIRAGAERICFVVSPGKSDILEYFGGGIGRAAVAFVVQPKAEGLCDAIFRALPFVGEREEVVVGLPDTVWFPEDGLAQLTDACLSFLLFPVERPELFDAVVADDDGRVSEIEVKSENARSSWIWGAFRMPASVLRELHALWQERGRKDVYVGTLVNAYIARGGEVRSVRGGESYVDVGTLHGYREAIRLLERRAAGETRETGEDAPPHLGPVRDPQPEHA